MNRRTWVLGLAFLVLAVLASPVNAEQEGGEEIYKNYWRFGERITISDCVGLIKYKRFGFTRMGEPPHFQVRVNGQWKTVAKSKVVPNTVNCLRPSDFNVKVDMITKVKFTWIVSEVGDGAPDTRYTTCKGSARQLQVRLWFPKEADPPMPQIVIVCS
jgi:hypothetical protein